MSYRKPTTPNARSIRTAPSTTPAGNPPSYLTDKSTTPAGLPPSVPFGSSFNPSNNTFARKNNSFEVPADGSDGYSDEDADGDMEEEEDEALEGLPSPPPSQSLMSLASPASPRGLKRSRDGRVVKERSYPITAASQGLINRKQAVLRESDNVISKSEDILADLELNAQRQPAEIGVTLANAAAQLTKIWRQEADTTTKPGSIGPEATDGFTRANYLATLLLALHNPHTDKPGKAAVRGLRSSGALSAQIPVPRALLDWLDTYHKPFADDYGAICDYRPSPSAHESFWDVVYGNALRGKLDRVAMLLRNAGLEHAATAKDDFEDDEGRYTGHQLTNAKVMMERCAQTIQNCPGLKFNNWDVRDHDWKIFRQNVRVGVNELFHEAEGDGSRFAASQNVFGDDEGAMSVATRRAMSKIPWSIYENLKLLYGLLLGSPEEILMVSQDWLEASLYSVAWWDGEDDYALDVSLNRSSLRKSAAQKPRLVDVNPFEAYREKLALEFAEVTRDPEDAVFSVSTMDPVQAGLGCLLEGSVGTVINLLRTWSMPVAVAMIEVASLGRWISLVRPRSSDGMANLNFSKEDLLVLSAGPRTPPSTDSIDRDEILSDYADLLANKNQINEKEGWELAVAVLNRLDQRSECDQKILDLLDRLDLHNETRVDKVLAVCDAFGLTEPRSNIAERFADSLAEKGESHGATLIYYARAHATNKLKSHIEVLTSTCLLHSVALPPYRQMDTKLQSLLSKDRTALKDLARSDIDAATLLSSYLSGYAMLRKFYEVRDQDILATDDYVVDQPLKSLERRRLAASTLFAVIKSAADCIPGGLFDPDAEAVVSVDGLLVLFGETLPLLGQDKRIFTQQHVFALLAVIEDFVSSPSRIRENAQSLLDASLTAYKEATSATSGVFKKARGDLSASSSWDMLASVTAQGSDVGKTQRAWDWRQGLMGMGDRDVDSRVVVNLFREALVREVAGGWSGRLHWS